MPSNACLAAYLHEACNEAAASCPQFDGYESDQQVMVSGGRFVVFGGVPKKGISAVVKFWRDPCTEGSRILFELGYEAELPHDVAEVFRRYDELVAEALAKLTDSL
jgi:hypothetical protein